MEMALPTEDNGTKLKFEAWDPLNTSLTIPHNACKHGWCLVGWLWAVLGVVVQYFCYLCIIGIVKIKNLLFCLLVLSMWVV